MATIGKLGEFRTEVEDWSQYVERMEFYFVANGVTGDAKKKAALLSAIGPSTYKLLRSLIAPTTVQDEGLAGLITALRNHFEPQPSTIVQRAKFYGRSREKGETVAQYLSELRAIAALCNFGDKLDDMLRDRLVCGINDSAMQRQLLAEGDTLSLRPRLHSNGEAKR